MTAPKSNGGDEMATLVAQMEADRNQLAQRILGNFTSATSSKTNHPPSSASSKAAAPTSFKQKPRPSSLGVGAQIPESGTVASSSGASLQDARLKGRLTAKRKRGQEELAEKAEEARAGQFVTGKGKADAADDAEEEEEDDDTSRSKAAAKKAKGKGKAKDVFAVAAEKASKRQRGKVQEQPAAPSAAPQSASASGAASDLSSLSKSQRKKLRRKAKADQAGEHGADASVVSASQTDRTLPEDVSTHASAAEPVEHAPASSLTPLQASMSASLSGARFRSINEKLYTTDSRAALEMMRREPHLMKEYHDGFASQTTKWPVNPVLRIADRLRELAGVRGRKGKGSSSGQNAAKADASRSLLVADLGAGTAPLAMALRDTPAVKVLSYDLLDSPDGAVVGCDVGQRVPLPGRRGPLLQRVNAVLQEAPAQLDVKVIERELAAGPAAIDVVVFSLSLMGTNWVEMLIEARRILKHTSKLIIAEVTSRITDQDRFVALIEELGFRCEERDTRSNFFWLFEFRKAETVPAEFCALAPSERHASATQAAEAERELVKQGASLLKPCLYKKR